jgi:hypothetical protein
MAAIKTEYEHEEKYISNETPEHSLIDSELNTEINQALNKLFSLQAF